MFGIFLATEPNAQRRRIVVACFAVEPDSLQATQTVYQTLASHQDSDQLKRFFEISSIDQDR
jgi:hypothetical protein